MQHNPLSSSRAHFNRVPAPCCQPPAASPLLPAPCCQPPAASAAAPIATFPPPLLPALPPWQVVVAEGAPCYGGHKLAAALAGRGVAVTVIADAGVFALMARVNLVLLAAHAVMANGGVLAPIGLDMVALAARRHAVPFVVLAGIFTVSAAASTCPPPPLHLPSPPAPLLPSTPPLHLPPSSPPPPLSTCPPPPLHLPSPPALHLPSTCPLHLPSPPALHLPSTCPLHLPSTCPLHLPSTCPPPALHLPSTCPPPAHLLSCTHFLRL
ncbi:unnamed protein product [Closterium sp. Naga37s-1]|nr:unnamed protein product [Closterium sp. Naga37s-1]